MKTLFKDNLQVTVEYVLRITYVLSMKLIAFDCPYKSMARSIEFLINALHCKAMFTDKI